MFLALRGAPLLLCWSLWSLFNQGCSASASGTARFQLQRKVRLRDSRELPLLIRSVYETETPPPSSTCVLSCLTGVLNAQKVGSRVRNQGIALLAELEAPLHHQGLIPREHVVLAALGLECMLLPEEGMQNMGEIDLAGLPSPSEFRREIGLSQWLAWHHLERLRAALMQQSSAAGANRDVVAVAVVDAFIHDRRVEMRLLCILEQAAPPSSRPPAVVSRASSLLDEIVALGTFPTPPPPLPFDFLIGGAVVAPAERWQRGLDWTSLRNSAVLKAYLATADKGDKAVKVATVISKSFAPPPAMTRVLCLGDGDFSHTLALHDSLAGSHSRCSLCTSSLLSRNDFCRMYRAGASNLEELVRRGIEVYFGLDVAALSQTPSSNSNLEADVSQTLTDNLESSCDIVVFLFPLADANKQRPGKQFDTFYISTGRHQELLGAIFAAAARLRSGRVVLSLLMSQAVQWQAQRIGSEGGFKLVEIHPFDPSGYTVRRSHADASFPDLASAHLFVFQSSSLFCSSS